MARLFTVASDASLIEMISTAKERLVVVAPGLSRDVAIALANRITSKNCPTELSVTLDVDPEVCRLGYGDVEALDILRQTLESRGRALQVHTGLRICLVVTDSNVLVYSPTPQLIEAGSTSDEKPNAIRIAGAGPQELAFACGASESGVLGLTQEVGLHPVTEEAVREAEADLKENPPRKFDLVRLERVFNYKLEFVEFSVEGFRLNMRSVPLPATLLGLVEKDLRERLRNSFRVFESGVPFEFEIADPGDAAIKHKVTEKWLADQAKELRDTYFIPLRSSSYGNLILKRTKADFQEKLAWFVSMLELYADLVRKNIAARIRETRDSLVKSLYPRVAAAPPAAWLSRSVSGTLKPEYLLNRLEEEVDRAFVRVADDFCPRVSCVFKGVQYETITDDPHFRLQIEDFFGKEEASQLLFEYEASRAEDPSHRANGRAVRQS
jgi:hypothetical protein